MSFSPQDKAQFVRIFIQEGDDYAKFQRRIRKERGRHAQIPPHNTLKRWMEKFEEGDGQKRVKSPRTKTVRTPENIQAVKDLYTNDEHMSTRRAINALGISLGSVHTILKKDIKFHPYKMQLTQELTEDDHETIPTFQDWMS